jgi:hypothetical protein
MDAGSVMLGRMVFIVRCLPRGFATDDACSPCAVPSLLRELLRRHPIDFPGYVGGLNAWVVDQAAAGSGADPRSVSLCRAGSKNRSGSDQFQLLESSQYALPANIVFFCFDWSRRVRMEQQNIIALPRSALPAANLTGSGIPLDSKRSDHIQFGCVASRRYDRTKDTRSI